jgi:uncharacterized protein
MDAPQACIETRSQATSQPLLANARFLVMGLFFGVLLVKSEVVSWYRIQEMFRFQSFHMYGVIGMAVLVGLVSVWLIKRYGVRALDGSTITFTPKDPPYRRYLYGGTLFGLGWAMTGACPGPIAALIGGGYSVLLVVLLSAILGTWTYGALRTRLPH